MRNQPAANNQVPAYLRSYVISLQPPVLGRHLSKEIISVAVWGTLDLLHGEADF